MQTTKRARRPKKTPEEAPKEYYRLLWKSGDASAGAKSIKDMIHNYMLEIGKLKEMENDGVVGEFGDTVFFYTDNKEVAQKYDMPPALKWASKREEELIKKARTGDH